VVLIGSSSTREVAGDARGDLAMAAAPTSGGPTWQLVLGLQGLVFGLQEAHRVPPTEAELIEAF
jgi:hypothetical protein